jgi:nucleoside-diphosphate-sugar epimerase
MAQTVLVTGGSGFVAGWCLVELLRRGFAVRATVRDPAKAFAVREAVAAAGADGPLAFVAADLTRDAGWDEAIAGCAFVLHVASPLGGGNDEALLAPAREGTLRVLRAATRAGVARVVMTSAATAATPPATGADTVADESVWFDPNERGVSSYRRSKRLAERAAWDFMAAAGGATTLTTVLPGAVFGPVLTRQSIGSAQVVERLLQGRPPGLPRIGFSIVDVRDLADLHVRALTAPEAAGQRFLAAGRFTWMAEIAGVLRAALGDEARRVPTRVLPDPLVRALSWFVPPLRALTPLLGRRQRFTAAKAERVLGLSLRPWEATVVDCARSLLPRG